MPNERGWEYLDEVPAIGLESYGYVAPTIYTSPSDSSEIFYTSYLVNAHFEGDLYASAPDSGFSLDNISPSVPDSVSAFAGYSNSITVNLSWAEPVDEDFQYFSIFRDNELIGYVTENVYSDEPISQSDEVVYYVTATDINGNESSRSNEAPTNANYRGVGLSDMIYSIENNIEHRCNEKLILHVLDMLDTTIQSAKKSSTLNLRTTCNKTKPFTKSEVALISK